MTNLSPTREKTSLEKPIPAFVLAYSDSSFSNPHQVVSSEPPQFDAQAFTYIGKEMDGIESKRHKTVSVIGSGKAAAFEYDPCAFNWFEIGLKQRSSIEKIYISTRWFTGNQVRRISLWLKDEVTGNQVQVLHRQDLKPDAEHQFDVPPTLATEYRVECIYDGGISRVHLFGAPAEPMPSRENLLESAAISHVSNEHYGKPSQAIAGDRQVGHMLGWESARSGFGERALFHLKSPATIDEIVVDTYMHVHNSPLSCHVFALNNTAEQGNDQLMQDAPRWIIRFQNGKEVIPENIQSYISEEKFLEETGDPEKFEVALQLPKSGLWKPLVQFAPLSRDTYHRFKQLEDLGPVTHILFMYFPNGGIHGLKVYGRH